MQNLWYSKYFLKILFFFSYFFATIASGQDSCPAAITAWYVGSGNNFFPPDPIGPYKTQQDALDAALKSSEQQFPGWVYTPFVDQESGYVYKGYYVLTINGVLYHQPGFYNDIGAIIGVSQLTNCPSGFTMNNRSVCVNATTYTCGCPAGQKFKLAANMCVANLRISNDADPDNDNGPNCPKGNGEPGQPVCGNPINPGSGNKFQIETDYLDKSASDGLSIRRIYNGSPNQLVKPVGLFGAGWSFAFDSRIVVTSVRATPVCYSWTDDGTTFCESESSTPDSTFTTEKISALRLDGKKIFFSRDLGNNAISKDNNINASALYNPSYANDIGPVYSIVNEAMQTENYSVGVAGALLSIKDLAGTTRSVTSFWNSNNSSIGRWPANSPICNQIQGGAIVYGNRPLCVTDNWGRQLNFEYEQLANSQVRITKIFDPNGQQYTYSYDGPSSGCPTLGDLSIACAANNLTSVTFPDGHSRIYHYNEAAQINGGNDCSQFISVGNGFSGLLNSLTGITDENGVRFATWTYDCNGRATSSQHAGGAEKVTVAYSDISADGTRVSTVTNYTGDPAAPIATSRSYTYKLINGTPKMMSSDTPCIDCSNVATRSYDANGNTAAVTDWDGNRTTFVFDTNRNLETSRVEAAGTAQARTISTTWHETMRLPLQISEPKRLSTFTYDIYGNLLTRTIRATTDLSGASGFGAGTTGAFRTWTYTYNNVGQMLSVTGPRTDVPDVTRFAYDADGNLTSITNALNQVTTLSNYDANRNVGKIAEPNGTVTLLSYTPRGWLNSRTIIAGELSQTSSYSYDGVGQLSSVTQPDGSSISYNYDDAHRLVAIADAMGNRVVYRYDSMSNRMTESIIDPQNLLRRQIVRSYDILNQLHQITGASL